MYSSNKGINNNLLYGRFNGFGRKPRRMSSKTEKALRKVFGSDYTFVYALIKHYDGNTKMHDIYVNTNEYRINFVNVNDKFEKIIEHDKNNKFLKVSTGNDGEAVYIYLNMLEQQSAIDFLSVAVYYDEKKNVFRIKHESELFDVTTYEDNIIDFDTIKSCPIFPSELLALHKPIESPINDLAYVSIDGLYGMTMDHNYFFTTSVFGFMDDFKDAIESGKLIRILDNYYSVDFIYNDDQFIPTVRSHIHSNYDDLMDRKRIYEKIIPLDISLVKDDGIRLFLTMNQERICKE